MSIPAQPLATARLGASVRGASRPAPLRVLGLDPGSRHTGFGLVERHGSQLVAGTCGRISPDPRRPLSERLGEIAAALERLLAAERPDRVAIERVFAGASARSAIVLAEARGALLAVLGRAGIEVEEVAPAQVKSAVAGSGRADKSQVARMVCLQLGLARERLATDATDALAIAICVALRATWAARRGGETASSS